MSVALVPPEVRRTVPAPLTWMVDVLAAALALRIAEPMSSRSDAPTAVKFTLAPEFAIAGLPPLVDGARRSRLVHVDALATTWEAWDVHDGTRLLVVAELDAERRGRCQYWCHPQH